MAKVRQRTWTAPGQRTKRKAWGFVTVGEDGKQIRVFRSDWSKEDAEKALAERTLKIEQPKPSRSGMTLQQAIERYTMAKARKKSIEHDVKYYLPMFAAAFGNETPIVEITPSRIAEWRDAKLAATNPRTDRPYAGATINRPLAALRHLLRLAYEEWGVLPMSPGIVRRADEPQGRIRWLEPDEEARLLASCAKSKNAELLAIVTIAMETGLRRGELLGLTWDRIDLTRGVVRLEITKSGKRREVRMRQIVYNTLAAMSEPREGRLFRTHSIRTAFENAVAEAKIDNLRFHDLRHHFASWFVMRGGSLQALQQILGHADIKMTTKYAHLSPDHLRSEMEKTERPIASEITQPITHEPVDRELMSRK